MAVRDVERGVETWQSRERALPRVPPTGWRTTDRLREAVCLAVACSVDGVERVEPYSGPATERERFDAMVTTESVDDEHVQLLTPAGDEAGDGETAAASSATDENGDDFEETTKQFDLDEALDRL